MQTLRLYYIEDYDILNEIISFFYTLYYYLKT